MRKRRLLIVLGSVAALGVVLFFVNKWLIAEGKSLTLHMGTKLERPEFVQVNSPFNVDIVYHVSDMLKGTNCYAWDVQRDFILRNDYNKDIRVHLPLLRASFWNPPFTQFIFNSDLDPEWKKSKNISLKPGESFKVSLPRSGLETADDLFDGHQSKEHGRWALVFGVPDGEDSDKYLVGTVLSNPIEYRNELKDKSQK
jgi:hypothetical protein